MITFAAILDLEAVLIVAMFMGYMFNAMNIILEKEDGAAFVNEILPMTPSQYIFRRLRWDFCLAVFPPP